MQLKLNSLSLTTPTYVIILSLIYISKNFNNLVLVQEKRPILVVLLHLLVT